MLFISATTASADIGELKTIGTYPPNGRGSEVEQHRLDNRIVTMLDNGSVFAYGVVLDNISITKANERIIGSGSNPPAIRWDKGWKDQGYPPECPQGSFFPTATPLADNKILFAGGFCNASRLLNDDSPYPPDFTKLSLWNDVTQKWEVAPSLHEARLHHTATLLKGNSVLIVGGESHHHTVENEEPVLDSVELYRADVMLQLPHLHFARAKHTTTQLNDGNVLVIGGFDQQGKPLSSVEIWDAKTQAWHDGAPLSIPRYNHTATLLSDGRLMITGGISQAGLPTNLVEIWDTATQTWSNAAPLLQPLRSHSATALSNGDVLVVGTSFDEHRHAVSQTMLWRAATAQWQPAGTLSPDNTGDIRSDIKYFLWANKNGGALLFSNTLIMRWLPTTLIAGEYFPSSERQGYTTASLNDGRILLAGGHLRNTPFDLTEIYDPASNQFSSTGRLNQPRYTGMPYQEKLSSVVTDDGEMVIAGGWVQKPDQTEGSVANFAEVWNPATGQWRIIQELRFEPQERVYLRKLDNGDVLFFSSKELSEEGSAQYRALVWQPRSNSVEKLPVTATPRVKAAIALLADGRVLIVGGSTREFVPEYICPQTTPHSTANTDADSEEGDGCQDEPAHWQLQRADTAELWNSRTDTTASITYPPSFHAENPQTLVLNNGNVLLVNAVMPHPMQTHPPQPEWLWNARTSSWTLLPPLAVDMNWPMTELNDGSLVAWAASNVNPSHAQVLKPNATTWQPMLRFPQIKASVIQLPSGQLLAISSTEPYAAVFEEKPQQWLLRQSQHVTTSDSAQVEFANGSMFVAVDDAALVELADGKLAVLGTMQKVGMKKLAQIWNPQTNAWAATRKIVDGRTTGNAILLPSGAVLNISYGAAGSYLCDIWQPDDDSWQSCGTLKPTKNADYANFVLGHLNDHRVVFMSSAEQAFVFDENAHNWAEMKTRWNLESMNFGFAIHTDKPLAEFFDPASNEWLDANAIAGKYYSMTPPLPNMLWDPIRHHWAYAQFRIMGSNGFWLPDGCAIAGPPFKIYNPSTGKITEYPELYANWMKPEKMIALKDGTVVITGEDATGAKFFHHKATCAGFEVIQDDNFLMPGIWVQATPTVIPSTSSEPELSITKKWLNKISAFIADFKWILLALFIPIILYFPLRAANHKLQKSYPTLSKPLGSEKGGRVMDRVLRFVIYSILAMLVLPGLWGAANTQWQHINTPTKKTVLPCRYIGVWSSTTEGRFANRITLKDDGRYIFQASDTSHSNIPPKEGSWEVQGENMVWDTQQEFYEPDANQIIDKSETSFTLRERNGKQTRFELIDKIKSTVCAP